MPLTSKGAKILDAIQSRYGAKRGKSVFYASINSGKIRGAEGKADGGRTLALAKRLQRRRYQDGGEVDESAYVLSPQAAAEAAAARTRQSVRPAEGRASGELTQFIEDTMIPKTPLDAGLMVAGGPFGRLAKAGALGLGAALQSSQAEAGPLAMLRKGIKAYHGSPHDFDRFDISKIGTGEGAQAYGHGIYLAENPAVAESYRSAGPAGNVPAPTYKAPSDVLARNAKDFSEFAVSNPLLVKGFGSLDVEGRSNVLPMVRGLLHDPEISKAVVRLLPVDMMNVLGGKQLTSEKLLHNPSMLVNLLPSHSNDLVSSRVAAMDILAPYVARATAERPLIGAQSRSMLEEALSARGAGKGDLHVRSEVPYPSRIGNMYEVNINARPEQFLDWDKPFVEQSPQVQKGVRDILGAEPAPQMSDAARGYDIHNQVVNRGVDTRPSIYRDDRLLWKEGPKNKVIASSMLNEAGIPGIKYLDQGSRTDFADLTRNIARRRAELTSDPTSQSKHKLLAEAEEILADAKAQPTTSNYVLFDDKIVDIMRKYGLTGMLGGVGAGATAKSGDQGMADGGIVDRLPEHYAEIGGPRIEDRRDSDPTLRAMGLAALKTRASGKQARNRMASDMGSAEIVDMMVPRGYADGGAMDSPYANMMPQGRAPHSGFIPGQTGGRTDAVPMSVKQKSYVIPADVVSSLGEGNSEAGAKKLGSMFSGPYGTKAPKIKGRAPKTTKVIRQKFQDGGMVDMEPPAEIAASSGEYVVDPEQVAALGGGDTDHGHDILDALVKQIRQQTIKTLKRLPGPKKS